MSDAAFVDKQAEIPETNINVEQEDAMAEKSDATGQVSQRQSSFLCVTLFGF